MVLRFVFFNYFYKYILNTLYGAISQLIGMYIFTVQETLGQAMGVLGIVNKHRTLYMIGQTRVHIDQVLGLGDFMELEVRTIIVNVFFNDSYCNE